MAFHFSSVNLPKDIFPGLSQKDWENWKWQIRNSLKTQADYEKYFSLSSDEKSGFKQKLFAVQTTPYYASLAGSSAGRVLTKIIHPLSLENQKGFQALKDPLGEERHSPEKHLIHRYPDRVVFLITDICPIYCRYCTRKRFTGQTKKIISQEEYEKALKYIQKNKGIKEVILSGGDPLTLTDVFLNKVLQALRAVKHIQIIRIGSRMPAVCPYRFTDELLAVLKNYSPVYIMSHFNHPAEITKESATALCRLADQGIPVYNQMVLINGLNNHPAVVQALSRRLLFLRARPYYMFQCDPSLGTDHLRTSIENSKWIQKQLWGRLSGLALPRLAVDLPGGAGKVELSADSFLQTEIRDKNQKSHFFKGWDEEEAVYKDPENVQTPKELQPYLEEWEEIFQQKYGASKSSLGLAKNKRL